MKRPNHATSTDTRTDTRFSIELRRDRNIVVAQLRGDSSRLAIESTRARHNLSLDLSCMLAQPAFHLINLPTVCFNRQYKLKRFRIRGRELVMIEAKEFAHDCRRRSFIAANPRVIRGFK